MRPPEQQITDSIIRTRNENLFFTMPNRSEKDKAGDVKNQTTN